MDPHTLLGGLLGDREAKRLFPAKPLNTYAYWLEEACLGGNSPACDARLDPVFDLAADEQKQWMTEDPDRFGSYWDPYWGIEI